MQKADDMMRSMYASMLHMAESHARLGQIDKALDYYNQALTLAHQRSDRDTERHILGKLAGVHDQAGSISKSIELRERALAIHRDLREAESDASQLIEADLLSGLATSYTDLGQFEAAAPNAERAVQLLDAVIGRSGNSGYVSYGTALGLLGMSLSATGDSERGLEIAQRGSEAANATGETRARAYAGIGLMVANMVQGVWDAAVQSGDAATAYLDQISLGARRILLSGLAISSAILDRPGQALAYAEQALAGEGASRWVRANALTAETVASASLGMPARAARSGDDALTLVGWLAASNRQYSQQLDAWATLAMGQARLALNDLSAAMDHFSRAENVGIDLGSARLEARAILGVASVHDRLGKGDEAQRSLEQALALARRSGDRPTVLRSQLALINLRVLTGNLEEVRNQIPAALRLAKDLGDRRGEAEAYGAMGLMELRRRQHRAAIDGMTRALEGAREDGDRGQEQKWLSHIGNVYADQREADSAIDAYSQALAISQELGNRSAEGQLQLKLGLTYAEQNRATEAISTLREAIVVFRELNMGDLLSQAEYALSQAEGRTSSGRGAAPLIQPSGDPAADARKLEEIGMGLYQSGDYIRAVAAYEEAIRLTREIGDRAAELSHHIMIGNAYAAAHAPDKAMAHYKAGLGISQEVGDRLAEAQLLLNLGVTYGEQDFRKEAAGALEAARAIFVELNQDDFVAQTDEYLSMFR